MPSQTPPATCDTIEALRRERCTQDAIASAVGLSRSTVSRILKRRGLSLLSALEPKAARPRYERKTPGEIIHIDIKKLGRFNRKGHRITGDRTRQSNQRYNGNGPGWEYVHVAVDDHSRIAFSEIKDSEKKGCAVAFLKAGHRLLCRPRHLDFQGHDGQWRMLQIIRVSRCLQTPQHQAPAHKTIYAADQWQS